MNYSFEEIPLDLGPCPMGPSHTKNTISPFIHSAFDNLHGSVYSVDNLRFRLSASPTLMQEIIDSLDRYDGHTDDVLTYSQGGRIGGYRYLWTWRYDAEGEHANEGEKTSVALGYVHVNGKGKYDCGTGFIEFNPNKLPRQGFELLRYLEMLDIRHTLVKYDLAIDYPVQRDKLRMKKDGRKYACEISDSMTEYLGQRNKPGRVKVYDKACERGYKAALSRVELTCDGDWTIENVLAQLPVVYNYDTDLARSLHGVTLAFALAVHDHVSNGQPLEPWLRLVNPKTRAKVRGAFDAGFQLKYDTDCIREILNQVKNI